MMNYWVYICLAILIVSVLCVKIHRYESKKIEKIKIAELDKIEKEYPELFNSKNEYSFYTTGHPYVWVASNYDEFKNILFHSCYQQSQGFRMPLKKPIYSLKVDSDKKTVYMVGKLKDFRFPSLMHYNEWLASQSEVAERIKQYKNS